MWFIDQYNYVIESTKKSKTQLRKVQTFLNFNFPVWIFQMIEKNKQQEK